MVDEALLKQYEEALDSRDPARIKELAKQVDEARTAERIAEGRSEQSGVPAGVQAEPGNGQGGAG